jgi:glucose-6-phosphate dehydrogenase assembly protein OpcA
MAQRRITDAAATSNPMKTLERSARSHVPGDTDLAWSRITLWRGLLAAAFDQPPYDPVTSGTVTGASDSPSAELLAAWLGLTLRCPMTRTRTDPGTGLVGVVLERESGPVELDRPEGTVVATLTQPGQPERRVSLPPRSDRDCLAEELRRLDDDEIYAEVLTEGLKLLHDKGTTRSARGSSGKAAKRTVTESPSPVANDEPPPPPSPTAPAAPA